MASSETSPNKFVGTIDRLVRMDSSRNGNPRWMIYLTEGGPVSTSHDASISYALDNPEFRGVPVEFTLDARHQVVNAVPVVSDAE